MIWFLKKKNDNIIYNFEKDPIDAFIDNEWVKAKDTTLGADNGIGIAAIMVLLESKDIEHPAIEVLLTTDEESGMIGALKLKPELLKGDINWKEVMKALMEVDYDGTVTAEVIPYSEGLIEKTSKAMDIILGLER